MYYCVIDDIIVYDIVIVFVHTGCLDFTGFCHGSTHAHARTLPLCCSLHTHTRGYAFAHVTLVTRTRLRLRSLISRLRYVALPLLRSGYLRLRLRCIRSRTPHTFTRVHAHTFGSFRGLRAPVLGWIYAHSSFTGLHLGCRFTFTRLHGCHTQVRSPAATCGCACVGYDATPLRFATFAYTYYTPRLPRTHLGSAHAHTRLVTPLHTPVTPHAPPGSTHGLHITHAVCTHCGYAHHTRTRAHAHHGSPWLLPHAPHGSGLWFWVHTRGSATPHTRHTHTVGFTHLAVRLVCSRTRVCVHTRYTVTLPHIYRLHTPRSLRCSRLLAGYR